MHYVKAGVGGTPSELGMVRYDLDVTKNGEITPDLVVVEFAVNDWSWPYDGILRRRALVLRVL